jgi:hypothetical protein
LFHLILHYGGVKIKQHLTEMVEQHKRGNANGIYAVCSAHPLVLEAAILSDVSLSSPFRMVMIFIFRFVSFNPALWRCKNSLEDIRKPVNS